MLRLGKRDPLDNRFPVDKFAPLGKRGLLDKRVLPDLTCSSGEAHRQAIRANGSEVWSVDSI